MWRGTAVEQRDDPLELVEPAGGASNHNLARLLLPFVPFRTLLHWSYLSDSSAVHGPLKKKPAAKPRLWGGGGVGNQARGTALRDVLELRASVLLLDVSGFTKLSQDYGSRGTTGREAFSVFIGYFFHKVSDVICSYGGDIDCFAGDAVLVLFRPHLGDTGIEECTLRAIKCAQAAALELSGLKCSPEDPPLRVHCGLASGSLRSVVCSGRVASRCESFLLGEPMKELGIALGHAEMTELVLGPSAVRATGGLVQGEARPDGCICIPLGSHQGAAATKADTTKQGSVNAAAAKIFRELDAAAAWLEQIGPCSPDGLACGMGAFLWRYWARARKVGQNSVAPMSDTAIEALPKFVPSFVRQRLLASSSSLDLLAEHRSVSVLFVVGKVQAETQQDSSWASLLALSLGSAMDVAEGRFGACTRQVTVDDKGIALIFVFGLPGFLRHNHCAPCAESAVKVLDALNVPGVTFCAGVASGPVFCGIVGNPEGRCEYAVMGDTVNVAARLAGYGLQNGIRVTCASQFKDELETSHEKVNVVLELVGSTLLKGKQDEVVIFKILPQKANTSMRRRPRDSSRKREPLQGRSVQVTAINRRAKSMAESGGGMVLVKAASGAGKSAMMRALEEEAISFPLQQDDSHCFQRPVVVHVQLVQALQAVPLATCHQILVQVLRMHRRVNAGVSMSNLEALPSVPDISQLVLPSALKGYADRLESLKDQQPGPSRAKGFQHLYVDMIRDALKSPDGGAHCVLIVDDLHYADLSSIWVLQQLVSTKRKKKPAYRTTFTLGGAVNSTDEQRRSMDKGFNPAEQKPQKAKRNSSMSELFGIGEPREQPMRRSSFQGISTPAASGSQEPQLQSLVVLCSMLDDESSQQHRSPSIEAIEAMLKELGPSVASVEHLPPLEHADIALMAAGILKCSSLTDELASLISDFAQGIPANAQQIIWWLREEGMIIPAGSDNDGVLGVSPKRLAASGVPKSLHSMVMTRVDQLPARHVLVLRTASVFGQGFSTRFLRKLLEASEQPTTGLREQLHTLRTFNLISPAGNRASDERDSGTWQFCHEMYQRVIYQALPHRARQRLHELVIQILQAQLASASVMPTSDEGRSMMTEVADHQLLRVAAIPAQASLDGIASAACACSAVASQLFEAGHIEQGCLYEDKGMQLLKGAIEATKRREPGVVALEGIQALLMSAVEEAINNIAVLTVLGKDIIPDDTMTHRSNLLMQEFDLLNSGGVGAVKADVMLEPPKPLKKLGHRRTSLRTLMDDWKLKNNQDLIRPGSSGKEEEIQSFVRIRKADPNISRTNRDKAGSNQFFNQVIISAKFSKLFMQWEKSHEVLDRSLLMDFHSRIAKEDSLLGLACILPQLAMSWAGLTRFDMSRDAVVMFHDKYDRAGRPPEFRSTKLLMGIPAVSQMVNLRQSYENLLGQIDRPVNVRMKQMEFLKGWESSDYLGVTLAFGSATAFETFWEPVGSPRYEQTYQLITFTLQMIIQDLKSMWKPMFLHVDATQQQAVLARTIAQRLEASATISESGSRIEPQDAADLSEAVQSWAEEMRRLCNVATTKFWKLDVWRPIRLLLELGIELIWPRPAAGRLAGSLLPPIFDGTQALAAEHLTNISGCLSGLLKWWQLGFINRNGSSCLPAALIWAKAMLHWFQWVLWKGGHRSAEPEDARLVTAIDGWFPGPKLPPGPLTISRGLLLSRAMAAEQGGAGRTELMTAWLPAAISIAVLLIGDTQDHNLQPGSATHGSMTLRVCRPNMCSVETQPRGPGGPCIWTSCVRLGSSEAAVIACSMLEEVLQRITIGDLPINVEDVAGPQDVGNSVVLWRAVNVLDVARRMTKTPI